MYILICYDIEENRPRSRISKALLDAGLARVQKSVFEGEIETKKLDALKKRLQKYVKGNDSIRYYQLCAACAGKTFVQGKNLLPPEEKGAAVVM